MKLTILLIEDNPADIRLMLEILRESEIPHDFHIATDGEEGLRFLRKGPPFESRPTPDIIFLDLNLPKVDGRQVLKEVKEDPALRRIPIVVMSTSAAPEDVTLAYNHYANCFITKPSDVAEFTRVAEVINGFWLRIARLPSKD